MISSNAELYESIDFLIEELTGDGHFQWASAFENALSISSAPGEILGEIRLQLRRLQASGIADQMRISEKVAAALRYLNVILGPV